MLGSAYMVTPDNFLAQIRGIIEGRVREQLNRHLSIDPSIDRRQIIDIQMRQEREYIERLIEENEEEQPAQAEALRGLLNWLPQLERTLKGR